MGYDRRWLDEPHVGDHVGRTVWALGEILSTAWVPAVVGPAARLLDAVTGTLLAGASLRTGAYAALGLARLDPDRLEPHARLLLERSVGRLADAYESCATEGWKWFEDEPHVRQRAPPPRVDHRRRRSRSRGSHGDGARGAPLARGRVGARAGHVTADRAPRAPPRRACSRASATSNRSTPRRSSRPSWRRSRSPATSSTACAPSAPSTGSSAVTGSSGPSTTSRPAVAATASADEAANDNEGAESTLALHRAALVLDAAGLPAVVRHLTRAERGTR